MFQLVQISKGYGPKQLFQGLNWHVRSAQRVGLVGPNGAGKTTLLRIITNSVEADEGNVILQKGVKLGLLSQEPVLQDGKSVLDEVKAANADLALVEKELRRLEVELTNSNTAVMERYGQLSEEFERRGGYQSDSDAKRVLCGLGFQEEELNQPASNFSGGWRMRISLARLLLAKPDVLLLDEPTNHLDLESLEWLENHLAQWEGAIVTVSHDRYFLNRTCDVIAALSPSGITCYQGNYDRYLQQRQEQQHLLRKQYEQQQAEIAKTQAFIDRFRSKATKAAAVQSRIKQLEKLDRIELPPTSRHLRGFSFPQPSRSGRVVAELEGVTKCWGNTVVYEGLNLTVERGWKVALVGVNGAGKSTLLKILAGNTELKAGARRLGHNVSVGYFAQHQLETLDGNRTVLQALEDVADIENYKLIRGLLGAFLFSGEDVEKAVAVLSGGEKARVALARMLLSPVSLLMMDEPTNHLDMESRASLEDALRRYEGTVIVVSHDRYFINAVCDRVLEIDRGCANWYLGNYDNYLLKKKQEAESEVAGDERAVRTTAGRVVKVQSVGLREDEKARKRQEAAVRQAVYRATKGLKQELAILESSIAELEAELTEIDAVLSSPEVYQEGDKAQTLLLERQTVESKLEEALASWESLEIAIEAATQGAENEIVDK